MNKGITLSFPRNKAILIILAVIIGFLIIYIFQPIIFYQPITSWGYDGLILNFRADLREADKIPVYPSEARLYEILWNPKVTNITLVFKDTEDNQLTVAEAFELTFKLKVAYESQVTDRTIILTIPHGGVDSFDNLPSTEENPFIALVPPSIGDETAVRIEDHTIFIKAKSDPNPKVAIKNFDLATIKLLMIMLDIEI